MKRSKSNAFFGGTGFYREEHRMMDIREIMTHPTFANLLPIDQDLQGSITLDMRLYGFYLSRPLSMAVWPGQELPVLADGYARLRAAFEAGITHVPVVIRYFPSELAAIQHAICLQAKRRTTTDGALYRLCEPYDRLMDRGGDRRSEEARSKGKSVPFESEPSRSSQWTAQLLGCNYKKVEKIRKIRKDGTPEIQEAVKNDRMKINRAYNLIREMEKGEDEEKSRKKLLASQIKAAKILFTEENFAILKELGGDLSFHANMAAEVYMRRLRDKERAEEPETESQKS